MPRPEVVIDFSMRCSAGHLIQEEGHYLYQKLIGSGKISLFVSGWVKRIQVTVWQPEKVGIRPPWPPGSAAYVISP